MACKTYLATINYDQYAEDIIEDFHFQQPPPLQPCSHLIQPYPRLIQPYPRFIQPYARLKKLVIAEILRQALMPKITLLQQNDEAQDEAQQVLNTTSPTTLIKGYQALIGTNKKNQQKRIDQLQTPQEIRQEKSQFLNMLARYHSEDAWDKLDRHNKQKTQIVFTRSKQWLRHRPYTHSCNFG